MKGGGGNNGGSVCALSGESDKSYCDESCTEEGSTESGRITENLEENLECFIAEISGSPVYNQIKFQLRSWYRR